MAKVGAKVRARVRVKPLHASPPSGGVRVRVRGRVRHTHHLLEVDDIQYPQRVERHTPLLQMGRLG